MKEILFFLCFAVVVVVQGVPVHKEEVTTFEEDLSRDFENYFEHRAFGKTLTNVIKELEIENILLETPKKKWKIPEINPFCQVCRVGMNRLLNINDSAAIFDNAIQFCIDFGFGTEYVCENLIRTNEDDLTYIIANTPDVSGEDVCGIVFVTEGCTTNSPGRIWEVTLPDVPKPPIDATPYPEPSSVSTLKILHLSDTHFDPMYVPGSSAVCQELYLCCRSESNPSDNGTSLAGFWGSYGACDLPYWTLETMYAHIAETHPDIDIIIWTGDIVPHAVWNTSRPDNLAIITEMADLISYYFPNSMVFPSIGNHESDPVNLFSQPYITEPEFEMSWLYDQLVNIWQRWLPAQAAKSIAYSAYYSVPVRPGLKIISVNTMFCYGYNWWLIHDSSDIANELDLIAKELQRAEDLGEYVYLTGHIPSGNGDCIFTWSHEFSRIVSRYESTISGIFYGHTHKDHWEIYFDFDDRSRPVEIGYIAPSQTTYTDMNPGYKIYTVEGTFLGSRYRVLDHDNYILNLTEANEEMTANFFKLYSAKEEYGLADLSPPSWLDLVFRMNEPGSPLFDSYLRNLYKAGTPKMDDECDDECKSDHLCYLLVSDNSDHSTCDMLNSTQSY